MSLPHSAVGWSVIVAFPGLVTGHTLLNYWYNFGRGFYGENLCEINLNEDQWFRRCLKKKFVDKAQCTLYMAPETTHNRSQTKPDHKYELTIPQKIDLSFIT